MVITAQTSSGAGKQIIKTVNSEGIFNIDKEKDKYKEKDRNIAKLSTPRDNVGKDKYIDEETDNDKDSNNQNCLLRRNFQH